MNRIYRSIFTLLHIFQDESPLNLNTESDNQHTNSVIIPDKSNELATVPLKSPHTSKYINTTDQDGDSLEANKRSNICFKGIVRNHEYHKLAPLITEHDNQYPNSVNIQSPHTSNYNNTPDRDCDSVETNELLSLYSKGNARNHEYHKLTPISEESYEEISALEMSESFVSIKEKTNVHNHEYHKLEPTPEEIYEEINELEMSDSFVNRKEKVSTLVV